MTVRDDVIVRPKVFLGHVEMLFTFCMRSHIEILYEVNPSKSL